jgi:hypothetical protein
MATTKSSAKALPGKRPAKAATVTATKIKPASKAKLTAKPEQTAKAKAAPKAKTATKVAAAKPVAIPLEQRKHYIEMAAYYIAERRGFALGNLLEDWVQAEAEIDRLLAEGRLGG